MQALSRLLGAPVCDQAAALEEACDAIAGALEVEKVDAFVIEPASDTLVARGTSRTPLGERQKRLGLDRLPCANGGRTVQVFRTGEPWLDNQVAHDPDELRGIREALGVRSSLAVPLEVDGERRGVLLLTSTRPERFSADDLQFLRSVAGWVGVVAHRAELVARIARQANEQGRRAAADELVTVLAHDLRNHLHPLSMRITMIRRRAAAETRARDVDDADAALQTLNRLGRMVSELLDVARIENGLFAIEPGVVPLATLAREVATAMTTPKSAVEVTGPDELEIPGDATRLRQVLENLLSNAVRHSPSGEAVRVRLGAERPHAIVQIDDRGPGISPELLPVLFERFARGPGGGLGLGLYLAKQIVAAHGGTLSVQSAPAAGTCFRIELPMDVSAAPPGATPTRS